MLIDTHAHLYLQQFKEDRDEMIQRARDAGIGRMYLPNIDRDSIEEMLQLESRQPGVCFAMMGLHPCSVKADFEEQLSLIKEWLTRRPFVAIGEIGLDLYWDKTFFSAQKEAFRRQIDWAIELDRPIVIHSRDSTAEVIHILKEKKHPKLRGIFHCFGGSVEEAESIVGLGFLLGIGGVLTFKKTGLDKTMEVVALKHLVLETDAPYLAPVPYRGKRNESAYVRLIAQKLASIKGLSVEEVEQITTANALQLFGE